MVIWSVKDLQSVQTKLFSFYMCFGFSYLSLVSYFFSTAHWLLCSIQVCTAKMNLSDEVDLEDYVCRPDKITAADVSLLSLRGFSIIK